LKERETLLVTGGTGFIGTRLVAALVAAGHDVMVLTRCFARAVELPEPIRVVSSLDQIADDTRIDATVNLAGEPISSGPWTLRKRRRILRSRLQATRGIIKLIRRLQAPPTVLTSAGHKSPARSRCPIVRAGPRLLTFCMVDDCG
jgi:uncharacterized protein